MFWKKKVKSYICPVCGYIHDDAVEKTKFKDFSDDWICPICKLSKDKFIENA